MTVKQFAHSSGVKAGKTLRIASRNASMMRATAFVFDAPINGRSFLAHVERALVKTLRAGGIVILDNLSSHKGVAVRRAIRAAGAKLFVLPPYSPDLNPIEQVFAKLKGKLRAAAPTITDGVSNTIAKAIEAFSPAECGRHLRHAGYGAT